MPHKKANGANFMILPVRNCTVCRLVTSDVHRLFNHEHTPVPVAGVNSDVRLTMLRISATGEGQVYRTVATLGPDQD